MKDFIKKLTLIDTVIELDDSIQNNKIDELKNVCRIVQTHTRTKYKYQHLKIRKMVDGVNVINLNICCGRVGLSTEDETLTDLKFKYRRIIKKKFGKTIDEFKEEKNKWETIIKSND